MRKIVCVCREDGCSAMGYAKGLCKRHYGDQRRKSCPERKAIEAALSRCYNPNTRGYQNYGGRGIRVCDRWRYGQDGKLGYECLIEDIGRRPSDKHSVDRINVNGNYEPGNVRWATRSMQSLNRRASKKSVTGQKGIFWERDRNRWVARIRYERKTIFRKRSTSYDELLAEYKEQEKKLLQSIG